MNADATLKLRLFGDMLRIRRVQERIESEYLKDQMRTPVHLCIGQEAVAVGVCAALGRRDYVSSNHRGHGHYLAKGGDLNALIAELHCRETGCSKGRGGSMHLVDAGVGHLGSSSIVGGGIPIGAGLGLAARLRGEPLVSAVFFGDGAADEGVLYESVNFSMLKKLPVIYVLENNGYAVCSQVASRQAGDNVFHGLGPDRLPSAIVDGNDVLAVYERALAAAARARAGLGPSFIECRTYRVLGHAGCASQDSKGYRPGEEVESWMRKCPVAALRDRLMDEGVLTQTGLAALEAEILAAIDAAFAFAQASPYPEASGLGQYLFRGE
ncbi:MAG: thiamine pyrophosphate-dependent dehydrogenase E1 component subunit alpha [Desulfovibrionaceae bacterium]|nr:thiamine pyrophosphate-dependent dehydrogenase E1 component subunit alpha [Desulfovibrionaceae bacterium]MBF0512691.1 thiamine pyrophosphate-dependent dehydrogenase E1 component subunit alpha [Desulfovibrionaceae bacterium]